MVLPVLLHFLGPHPRGPRSDRVARERMPQHLSNRSHSRRWCQRGRFRTLAHIIPPDNTEHLRCQCSVMITTRISRALSLAHLFTRLQQARCPKSHSIKRCRCGVPWIHSGCLGITGRVKRATSPTSQTVESPSSTSRNALST